MQSSQQLQQHMSCLCIGLPADSPLQSHHTSSLGTLATAWTGESHGQLAKPVSGERSGEETIKPRQ